MNYSLNAQVTPSERCVSAQEELETWKLMMKKGSDQFKILDEMWRDTCVI